MFKSRLTAILWFLPGLLFAQSTAYGLTETYANVLAAKLFRVLGGAGAAPVVSFVPTERLAACSVSGSRPEIHIDKTRVINKLERKYGTAYENDADDALACILGHEVWHIIKHKKAYSYKYWDSRSNDLGIKAAEIDADMHGLIGAYFIGMENCLKVYSEIFPTLDFGSTTVTYPGTEERLNVENEIKIKADELFYLYEGGNCLLATGGRQNMEQAAVMFEHIGEQFHFLKQINYNIGLAHLRLALADSKIPYLLPLEPAPNPLSGLASRAGAGGGNVAEQNKHLVSAAEYFEKARVQDPDWFDAWLGMIGVNMVRMAADPYQKQFTYNVYEEGNKWKRAHPGLKTWDEDRLKAMEAIAYLLQNPQKEKQKALTYLRAIQSGSADAGLQLQACFNLRACDEPCTSPSGGINSRVELPSTDGVDKAYTVYKQYERDTRGWANLIDPDYSILQKDLNHSHLLIIEKRQEDMGFPTVIQFYRHCGTLKAPAKTDNPEYRHLPGNGYEVLSWQTEKHESRCAKVLSIK